MREFGWSLKVFLLGCLNVFECAFGNVVLDVEVVGGRWFGDVYWNCCEVFIILCNGVELSGTFESWWNTCYTTIHLTVMGMTTENF